MKHVSRMVGSIPLTAIVATLVIAITPPAKLVTDARVKGSLDEETQARARSLWQQALAAKGGREQLRRINSLYVQADYGQGDRHFWCYVFSGYTFDYAYWASRERSDIYVRNAQRGITWWQVEDNPPQSWKYDAEDIYLNLLPQFVYLMMSSDLDPMPLRSRKDWLGLKRVDVVELEANGWRLDYYLDSKTHLPARVVMPWGPRARAKGEMDQQVDLENYSEVGGVMMPGSATHSFTTSPKKWKERLTFEINPKYDPKIFEQPPTRKIGPEAWRLKPASSN